MEGVCILCDGRLLKVSADGSELSDPVVNYIVRAKSLKSRLADARTSPTTREHNPKTLSIVIRSVGATQVKSRR